ncbi:MAG: hypothetical protein IOC43_14075, partial [Methylobacterium sp.]|nr:hypothetical protein [Methylobacterium sp.]
MASIPQTGFAAEDSAKDCHFGGEFHKPGIGRSVLLAIRQDKTMAEGIVVIDEDRVQSGHH